MSINTFLLSIFLGLELIEPLLESAENSKFGGSNLYFHQQWLRVLTALLPCQHLVLSVLLILAIWIKIFLEINHFFLKLKNTNLTTSLPCSSPPPRGEPQDSEWGHNEKLRLTLRLGFSPVGMSNEPKINHTIMWWEMELFDIRLVKAEKSSFSLHVLLPSCWGTNSILKR